MSDDIELLKKRFLELDRKSYSGGYYTFTDFLGLEEQSAFAEVKRSLSGKYSTFGGVADAERVMVRFGDEDEIGYDTDYPIVCIKIAPKSEKFADKLTHRDFLGALLNLGIVRDTLGDIVIRDNVGYLFAKEDIAEYITGELTRVKRTDVTASLTDDIPEGELYHTERRRIQAVGERLDAVIAAMLKVSRNDAKTMILSGKISVNHTEISNGDFLLKQGDLLSVRGFGRAELSEIGGKTRSDRVHITLKKYI